MSDDHEILFIRNVPSTVKKRFKSWCAANGISMTDKMVELMQRTVNDEISATTQGTPANTGSPKRTPPR